MISPEHALVGTTLFLLVLFRWNVRFYMETSFLYHALVSYCLLSPSWVPTEYYTHAIKSIREPPTTYPDTVIFLYLIQCSYHLSVWYTDIRSARRHSTLIRWHHMTTVGLIVMSAWFQQLPIGLTVMILHDLSALPMYMVRMIRVARRDGPLAVDLWFLGNVPPAVLDMSQSMVLGMFLIVWIDCRVTTLGGLVFDCLGTANDLSQLVMATLLLVLWIIHLIWFNQLTDKVGAVGVTPEYG